MAKERQVTFTVPETLASRIERITKKSLDELAEELVREFLLDHRRTTIEVHRMAISWHTEFYSALLQHVGSGGISQYVRQVIYRELSRTEQDLIPPPNWQEERTRTRMKKKVAAAEGRLSYICPIVIPLQWWERIAEKYPRQASSWVKAMVQRDFEKQTGKQFPVQESISEFLGR